MSPDPNSIPFEPDKEDRENLSGRTIGTHLKDRENLSGRTIGTHLKRNRLKINTSKAKMTCRRLQSEIYEWLLRTGKRTELKHPYNCPLGNLSDI